MNVVIPHEARGTTLYEEECADEHRRVYANVEQGVLEVGELTNGLLTYDVYGTNEHLHCVHIAHNVFDQVKASMEQLLGNRGSHNFESMLLLYFADGRYLADFMDDLDGWGVLYGYLNMVENGGVTYRRSQASTRRCYPHLHFVDS